MFKKKLQEQLDTLSNTLIELGDRNKSLRHDFFQLTADTKRTENAVKYNTNKLREMEKVIGYLVTENKRFKTDLIKNYINAQGQYKKYMAEHQQDGNKILADPYYNKLTGRIGTIEDAYKFLYNEPISDGIIDQYVNASNED